MARDQSMIEAIRRSFLFSELSEDLLRPLAAMARKVAFRAGSEIFMQGDPCSGFYLVSSGGVKVFRLTPQGRELVLSIVRPGGTFGEAALFSGTDYPAHAEALEDSILLFFPRTEFVQFIESHKGVPFFMLTGLSQQLRRLVNMLEDTALQDVDTRLARFLLKTAKALCYSGHSGEKIVLPVQKQVLASHLGTTPPTLSRALARLESEGLIALRDREIEFLDFVRLEAQWG